MATGAKTRTKRAEARRAREELKANLLKFAAEIAAATYDRIDATAYYGTSCTGAREQHAAQVKKITAAVLKGIKAEEARRNA